MSALPEEELRLRARKRPAGTSWMDWTRPRWERDFSLDAITDKLWRLNNLYCVTDANAVPFRFRMKPGMFSWFCGEHWRNVLLKARQYGATTYAALDLLDDAIFHANLRCQLTAHKLDDAQVIFRDKVKYAYESLGQTLDGESMVAGCTPEQWVGVGDSVRAAATITKETAEELLFGNNSGVRVTTSGRSGTLQRLHVSELGKMSAQTPEKAREVRTGSVPAAKNGKIWIESTAEGQEGWFYELCQESEKAELEGRELSRLDWKFHFHPWHEDPDYRLTPDEAARVPIHPRLREYFEELEATHGIKLDLAQKAWYVATEKTLGGDMKREYPSTPREAFESAIEGAIFGREMRQVRLEHRICAVPVVDDSPINTYWDLGYHGYMTIWFEQQIGMQNHFIDYHEDHGLGLKHYAGVLEDKAKEFGWRYGTHYAPHDIVVGELGTGRPRFETAASFGLHFIRVPRCRVKEESIQAARDFFPGCWFDTTGTAPGVARLDAYRYEWDELRGKWRDKPRDDEAAHGADGFQQAALVRKAKLRHGSANVARPVGPLRMRGHG